MDTNPSEVVSADRSYDHAGHFTPPTIEVNHDTGALPEHEICEPSERSPAELPSGIDHIVVLMMENRSFDHYFGGLSLEEGLAETISCLREEQSS